MGEEIDHDQAPSGDLRRVALIDALATVDASGKVWAIALINRHHQETLACAVKLGEQLPVGSFEATRLCGDTAEAFNDVDNPDRVAPEKVRLKVEQGVVRLPPHSLTIIKPR
jgi:alpha-L-arabinofuranosidase